MGQSRHSDGVPSISGLPRKADKFEAGGHVANVPKGDIASLGSECSKKNAIVFAFSDEGPMANGLDTISVRVA
jgi:hypothetical protein